MSLNNTKALYQPWNEDEFAGDYHVKKMSALQRWMYRTLLQNAFAGPWRPYLPADDGELWRLAGCENMRQWVRNKTPIVSRFSIKTVDGREVLSQKRVLIDWDREWKRIENLSARGRKAGAASVLARFGDRSTQVEHVSNTSEPPNLTEHNLTEQNLTEPNRTELSQEESMSLKKDIRVLCLQILGVKADPDGFNTWQEFNDLAAAYDAYQIRDAFTAWATEQRESNHDAYTRQGKWPVSEFLRVAAGLISGAIPGSQNPTVLALVADLVYASGGEVLFDAQRVSQVVRLRNQYTDPEILSAFRTFWGQIEGDAFQIKNAAKKFVEIAGQLIEVGRRQQAEHEQTRQQIETLKGALADEVSADLAVIQKAEDNEKELEEEGL